MGERFSFKCSQCGYNRHIIMGLGMWSGEVIDRIHSNIVKTVRDGKYGDEWRKELERDNSLAVNVSDELYICPYCGFFDTGIDLSLYKPVSKHCKKMTWCTDVASSWGYQLYREYLHACPQCGKPMIVYGGQFGKGVQPTCPKCGQRGEFEDDYILWD